MARSGACPKKRRTSLTSNWIHNNTRPKAMPACGITRGVRLVVAGKQGQCDAALAADSGQALDAIRPITTTSKQSDNHQLGLAHHAFDIEVDGKVVAELH